MMNIFKYSTFIFHNHILVPTHTKLLSTIPPRLKYKLKVKVLVSSVMSDSLQPHGL